MKMSYFFPIKKTSLIQLYKLKNLLGFYTVVKTTLMQVIVKLRNEPKMNVSFISLFVLLLKNNCSYCEIKKYYFHELFQFIYINVNVWK